MQPAGYGREGGASAACRVGGRVEGGREAPVQPAGYGGRVEGGREAPVQPAG